ncbi:myb-like protein D [Achroia grisella]|uniref:myb-like protein D n=1 Tax=Achroia grisella TaxID=688607 RepID=UPI0027D32D0B|nr:myb-like protein D [Achroia grisella]
MQTRKNKRKNKLSHLVKQEKTIITRLMKISLKLEDHIYKNKRISIENAITYMKEVCSYKEQCLEDARCLQVIEKLKRSMNAIIAEHEAQQSYDLNINSYETINFGNSQEIMSPVYSIDENDEMELIVEVSVDNIENIKDIADENVTKQDMLITHSIHEQDINIQQNVTPISNQFNLTDDNVQEYLSNLSIKETENFTQSNINSNDEIFSQSIISSTFKDINNAVGLINTEIEEKYNNNNNKSLNEPNSDIIIIHANKSTAEPIVHNFAETTEIIYDVPKTKARTKTLGKSNKLNGRSKKENKLKNNKSNPKNCTKIKGNVKNCNSKKVLINEIPTNSVREVFEDKKELRQNKYLMCVYNKTVENDLSWLENIRYVREVGTDETDTALTFLNESFWNDYTLPNGWSDLEFQ